MEENILFIICIISEEYCEDKKCIDECVLAGKKNKRVDIVCTNNKTIEKCGKSLITIPENPIDIIIDKIIKLKRVAIIFYAGGCST
eukprot:UN01490